MPSIPETTLSLVSFVPSIVIIVSAIIGWAAIYHVSNNAIIRHAKSKFISNILTVLIDLYPTTTVTTDRLFEIVKNSYPALNSTIYEFRFHVCKCQILNYDKTWQGYEEWRNKILQSNSETYNLDKAHSKQSSAQKEFHTHIEHLLKFAK